MGVSLENSPEREQLNNISQNREGNAGLTK